MASSTTSWAARRRCSGSRDPTGASPPSRCARLASSGGRPGAAAETASAAALELGTRSAAAPPCSPPARDMPSARWVRLPASTPASEETGANSPVVLLLVCNHLNRPNISIAQLSHHPRRSTSPTPLSTSAPSWTATRSCQRAPAGASGARPRARARRWLWLALVHVTCTVTESAAWGPLLAAAGCGSGRRCMPRPRAVLNAPLLFPFLPFPQGPRDGALHAQPEPRLALVHRQEGARARLCACAPVRACACARVYVCACPSTTYL